MKVYVSTGDTSAEQHVGAFINACKKQNPDTEFSAMGSDILRNCGVNIAIDSTAIKVMGLVAIIKHLPTIYKVFHRVLDYIEDSKPDAIVLVDYPGFHLRLAKAIKKRHPNLPIIYYITPQVWAWHTSRVNIIRKYVDHCMCILPFEEKWFKDKAVSCEYVGNPVMDAVKKVDPKLIRNMLELDEHTRLISIFPGSRRKELQYIFPHMMDAVEILREQFDDLAFAVAVAPGLTRSDLEKYHKIPNYVSVIEGHNQELMAASYFCFAKSGTTTLEAALLGCPMLVAYRGDWLSAIIAKYFLKISDVNHIALPNIIAGTAVVPEFLQEMVNGPEMARVARLMLIDWEIYDQVVADLKKVNELVGDIPAAKRAAEGFFKFMDSSNNY